MLTRSPSLGLEPLEDRSVPATFGLPWADPTRLTLSFAPDGTPVAGRTSNLFAGLNRDRSPDEWQYDVLRAYHTWAEHTNLDVAVVPDDGSPFGTPGRLQGDGRFGDVRVGGNRLTRDVLAFTSPSDPTLAGTLAGDVFVNTTYRFKGSPYDLYSVMLHEAGHSFGLDHSTDPNSPLFPRFNNTKTALTAADVAAIRALYGPRVGDVYEGPTGNGTVETAASFPVASGYTGDTPLLAYADVTAAGDADVFAFDTILGRDEDDDGQNITVTVQSLGVSLLTPKVTVYYLDHDGNPQEVANAKADKADYLGATLRVTFDGNDDDDGTSRRYYVKVEAADDGPFRTGRYAVAASFDGLSVVPLANLNRVAAGPYRSLSADDLARLLRDPGGALVNPDGGTNDSIPTATPLAPVSSANGVSRFELAASLAGSGDADVYRLTAPGGTADRVLTVHVWAAAGQSVDPAVEVYDATGQRVPAEVLVNDTGTFSVQAAGLMPGSEYYVRVAGGGRGNYLLTADFGSVATEVRTFAEGPVSATAERTDTLYIGQTQLFHFSLTAEQTDAPAGSAMTMTMTITDLAGNVVFTLTAAAGESVTGPAVLLRPGEYRVRYTAGGSAAPISFQLRGNRITDPVGPVADDVTLLPEYRDPSNPNQFRYPPNHISLDPFFWFALPLGPI